MPKGTALDSIIKRSKLQKGYPLGKKGARVTKAAPSTEPTKETKPAKGPNWGKDKLQIDERRRTERAQGLYRQGDS